MMSKETAVPKREEGIGRPRNPACPPVTEALQDPFFFPPIGGGDVVEYYRSFRKYLQEKGRQLEAFTLGEPLCIWKKMKKAFREG
jgi:hypothetical protein